MTDKVLPIIFFNLSGEMIYVIQQRLEAQQISEDKSKKVFQDIIATMFNDQFIGELFKPQQMYSRSAMLTVFEKLVHSSIMKLNGSSMRKLYDLMLMVFKYQVLNCQTQREILLVTLNHLDEIHNCVLLYPDLKKRTESVFSLLISTYKDLSPEEYKSIYDCIIAFLHDLNIRVSVLMKLGLQLQSGEIVVKNTNKLCLNTNKASFKKIEHTSGVEDKNTLQTVSNKKCFEFGGERGTTLGTNIYIALAVQPLQESNIFLKKEERLIEKDNPQVVDDLTLLKRLIGKLGSHNRVPEIILSTSDEEDLCQKTSSDGNCSFVKIDATQVQQSEDLGKISNDFCMDGKTRGKCDILELLDISEKDIL